MSKDIEALAADKADALIRSRSMDDDPEGIDSLADVALKETSSLPDSEYGLLVAAELRLRAAGLRSAKRASARLAIASDAERPSPPRTP